MEYKTRKITVNLTKEEYDFINVLAKNDGLSFYEECARIFHAELDRLMQIGEELDAEESDDRINLTF